MLELAADTSEADEISSYIQDARESADRLIGLVNDLLDVSRLRERQAAGRAGAGCS